MSFLYEVFKLFIKRNRPEMIANILDKSVSQVYRYAEDNGGNGTDLPAKYVPVITLVTKDFEIIKWLANKCGGYFVNVSQTKIKNSKEILQKLAFLTGKFSKILKASSQAIEDNVIDTKEKEVILTYTDDLINALGQFHKDLEDNGI